MTLEEKAARAGWAAVEEHLITHLRVAWDDLSSNRQAAILEGTRKLLAGEKVDWITALGVGEKTMWADFAKAAQAA